MNRQYGLDFARLMAAYFVAIGHLAFGGTFAVDEVYQRWVLRGTPLPLLEKESQSLWKLDYFLLVHWQTSAGIIGVGLFFVISGWVVPPMLNKYNTPQFLLNRVYRIFPMLMVSVLLAALIQYVFGNRESLTLPAMLSTMFLVNDITGEPFTLGVVWTLIVEFKFYLILALFGKLNHLKIFSIVGLIGALCGINALLLVVGCPKSHPLMLAFGNAGLRDLHYVVLMLVASSLQVALNQKMHPWYLRFVPVFLMVVAFNTIREIVVKSFEIRPWQDINAVSQLVIFAFFLSCLVVQRVGTETWLAKCIKEVSDMTYSLYLLHLSVGLFLMSLLKSKISNPYGLVLVVMLAVSLLSLATYHGVEKQFRYRFKSKEPTSPDGLGSNQVH